MTLFQDTRSDPRTARSVVADILAWYGAVGDAALGNTPGFALRKATIAVSLARASGTPENEIDAIFFAGMLHAAGAIGNPAYRAGEMLTERYAKMESWDVPADGAMLCATIAALPTETADLVRWQFEAWDGTGYPHSKQRRDIPLVARIFAVVDALEALTSQRPYKDPMPIEAVTDILIKDAGTHFDPAIVDAYLAVPMAEWMRLRELEHHLATSSLSRPAA